MPVSVDELNKSTTPCFSTLAKKCGVTPSLLLREIKLIAFSDPANHTKVGKGGALQFRTFEEQGDERRAIKKIKEKTITTKILGVTTKTSTIEYELHSKMDAIDMGLVIHGMKKPTKVELNGKLNIDVTGSRQKLLDRIAAIAERRGKKRSDKQPK
jgi:hypothetical protein